MTNPHKTPASMPVETPLSPVGCLTDVKAISGDVESRRILKLHYTRDVTDEDRARLVAAHNAVAASMEAETVKPIEGLRLVEREDDALICAPHWQGFSKALARKPALMSNEDWRPIAKRIIAALGASPPQPIESGVVEALRDIAAERQRQISAEGWTPEHDDTHDMGQMAGAAACYALAGIWVNPGDITRIWPWSKEWFKPSDRRRNLVKAGALIVAEIDRLDRKALAANAGGTR